MQSVTKQSARWDGTAELNYTKHPHNLLGAALFLLVLSPYKSMIIAEDDFNRGMKGVETYQIHPVWKRMSSFPFYPVLKSWQKNKAEYYIVKKFFFNYLFSCFTFFLINFLLYLFLTFLSFMFGLFATKSWKAPCVEIHLPCL